MQIPNPIAALKEPRPTRLFIGLPIYSQVATQFFQCLLALQADKQSHVSRMPDGSLNMRMAFTVAGKPCPIDIHLCQGDGVARSRNQLTAAFLKSDCTHLMWIDCDIIFTPEHIARLVSHDVPIVGGLYPKKQEGPVEWVINTLPYMPAVDARKLQAVRYAGTGFLCVQRGVIEQMIEAYPDCAYGADYGERNLEHNVWPMEVHRDSDSQAHWDAQHLCEYLLTEQGAKFHEEFSTVIERLKGLLPAPKPGRLLSEDYFFCQRAQELGIPVLVDTGCVLSHVGPAIFPLKTQRSALLADGAVEVRKEEILRQTEQLSQATGENAGASRELVALDSGASAESSDSVGTLSRVSGSLLADGERSRPFDIPRGFARAGLREAFDAHAFFECHIENVYRLPDKFAPGAVVVDIGAHIGSFAFAAIERGAETVRCYEADARNLDHLIDNQARMRDGGAVRATLAAVWRSDHCPATLAFHAIGAGEQNTGEGSSVHGGGLVYQVPAVRLAQVLEEFPHIDFLKIDVEGAEFGILQTCPSGLLRRVDRIAVEVHPDLPDARINGTITGTTDSLAQCLGAEGFEVEVTSGPPGLRGLTRNPMIFAVKKTTSPRPSPLKAEPGLQPA